MTLGKKIREARKEMKLTTTELAELTDLTQGYISHIENNRKTPSIEILKKLAASLKISFHEVGVLAGHFKEEDIKPSNDFEAFLNALSDEEQEKYINQQIENQEKQLSLHAFKENQYVQLEDFLYGNRELYANKSKLSKEDIKNLISLLKNREENYPSNEKIEEDFNKIAKEKFIIKY